MKIKHLFKPRNFIEIFGKYNLLSAIFCLFFFVIISWQVINGKINAFDESLLQILSNIFPAWFVYIAKVFYFLGEAEVAVFIVLFSLAILVWKKCLPEAQVVAVSSLSVLLLIDKILKPLFDRDRPLERLVENIDGRSYPSGHASGNLLLYFLLAYILSFYFPKFKVYFYVIAVFFLVLMGISSAYLRVHWFSDIVAAYCIGYILFTIAVGFLRILDKKYQLKT
jgi:undecaprenyl-diphosphatase